MGKITFPPNGGPLIVLDTQGKNCILTTDTDPVCIQFCVGGTLTTQHGDKFAQQSQTRCW